MSFTWIVKHIYNLTITLCYRTWYHFVSH